MSEAPTKKITEKEVAETLRANAYVLVTQKETVAGAEVESLRRVPAGLVAPVDNVLSSSSERPVQSKVLKNEFDEIKTALAGKGEKTVEVEISDNGDVTQSLEPGKIYFFSGALTSLSISLVSPAEGVLPHYHFIFSTTQEEDPPTVTLPNDVIMPDDFTVEAGATYEVDIYSYLGTVGIWTM